jgi:hypothetical protein
VGSCSVGGRKEGGRREEGGRKEGGRREEGGRKGVLAGVGVEESRGW